MDLKLDETTWDLSIENGDLALVTKSDAIRQNVRQRFWIFEGEYFLDQTEGVPYFRTILKKNPDLNLVNALLLDRAANTPGIIELLEWELDYDASSRTLRTSKFQARAFDGVVDFGSIGLLGGTSAAQGDES